MPRLATASLLVALCGAASLAAAQPAYRVKDIEPGPGFGSSPAGFLEIDGTIYFRAYNDPNGYELWATDGTAAGTRLVRDVVPGPEDSYPEVLTDFAGALFFVAKGELWRSDGTPQGTVRVRPDLSYPSGLVVFDGSLYFGAYDPSHGYELWRTDGTDAGTTLIKDIMPGPNGSNPFYAVPLGGLLYFSAIGPEGGHELWRTDGTEAGTAQAWDVSPGPSWSSPELLFATGNLLFFTADDGVHGRELWRLNILAGNALMVKDVDPGSGGSEPHDFAAMGGILYFGADGPEGDELWRSDGTPAGTFLVRDVHPGVGDSFPTDLTVSGGALFFSADDGVHGFEVWRSDGTAAGTTLVRDVNVPGSFPEPWDLTDGGGILFFSADDGIHGRELWRSDGTLAGTTVLDLRPGPEGSYPWELAAIAGRLYFSAYTPDSPAGHQQSELWTSDGTTGGSAVLARIGSAGSSRILSSADMNGTLFFGAYDGVHGIELWRSDGTVAGTSMVADIVTGPESSYPSGFVAMNGVVYFSAFVGGRIVLFRSDGTAAGTGPVTGPTHPLNWASDLRVVGSTLLFRGGDPDHGDELWRSDGTEAGTVLVRDIYPGQGFSSPTQLTVVGSTLFFVARDPVEGSELWRSDGTAAGTVRVQLTQPGSAGEDLTGLTAVGGLLYYAANDGFHGREPWRSDGTAAGTYMVRDVRPGVPSSFPSWFADMSGVAFFSADDGSTGRELWRSEGREASTTLVADIRPGPDSSAPTLLTRVGATLLFGADDGATGREPWRSDGTASGTTRVRDVHPGVASSLLSSQPFREWGGWAFFAADSPGLGQELWRSDGTADGTTLVQDIGPGPSSAGLAFHSPAGGRLFLRAVDEAGSELWALRPELTVTDAAAKEGTQAALQVSMIPVLDVPLAVPFATADGSATATFDYAPAAGVLTFAPGTTSLAVDVAVLEDLIDEPDEDFFLDLTGPASAYLTDPRGRAIVTDDDPTIVISVNDVEVTEGNSGEVSAAFTVSLTPPPLTTATVEYAAQSGTATAILDFSALSGTLTFTPTVATQLVHVPVFGDAADEPDEFFFLRLSNPTAAVIGDGEGIARIRDDDGGILRLQALERDTDHVDDLSDQPGHAPNSDLYIFHSDPWSSYEIVVDGVSGDLGDAGPGVRAETPGFGTVDAQPIGTGSARSLRLDLAAGVPAYHSIEVRSFGCTTDCGPDDTYRIRVRETTGHIARFNNVGNQRTVVILQNRLHLGVQARVTYWAGDGTRLGTFFYGIAQKESLVIDTTTFVPGTSGSITVSHDGPLGALAGKAVALDPTTGLAFDTPLTTRPR